MYNLQGGMAIDAQRSDGFHDSIALGFGEADGHKGLLE